jgi:hypothetical protein
MKPTRRQVSDNCKCHCTRIPVIRAANNRIKGALCQNCAAMQKRYSEVFVYANDSGNLFKSIKRNKVKEYRQGNGRRY